MCVCVSLFSITFFTFSDSVNVAYLSESTLVLYYCGTNHEDCSYAEASMFARYPYLDENTYSIFHDVLNASCFRMKTTTNVNLGEFSIMKQKL